MTNKQTESHCDPSNCSRHFEVCDCKSMCLLRYGAEIRKRQEEVGSAIGIYEKRRAHLRWLRLKRWGARRLID